MLVIINYGFIDLASGQESTRQAKRISALNSTEISLDGTAVNSVDMVIDKFGNVFVADSGNYLIQKFDGNGKFITSWGSNGTGNLQFSGHQLGISTDSFGDVFVADSGNHKIQKFDGNGKFITSWGSNGTGNLQFSGHQLGISTDSFGDVFVADSGNHKIQKFDGNGKFITSWSY